ncbi:MAG TPA: DNA polymerase III subunit gamma/tau, partial [Puia sp.]|nr:DNA polymerase III subunit gamma/tau [Puia sp.]
ELTLIKLCYLQQAIEIVSYGEGAGKKKLTESVKPVAYRNIQPIEIKKQVEAPVAFPPKKIEKESARLILETAPAEYLPEANPNSFSSTKPEVENKTAPAGPGFDALSKIRQQFLNRPQNGPENSIKPMEQSSLEEAWQQYTRQLKLNKNSATQSFQRAQLKIIDQNNFEITTNNNLEQKFIDQEKRNLSDFLQQFFNNKILNFSIVIATNPVPESAEEKMLSKKEQYLQIIEKYPLVKELKDRLKLELDY